MSRENDSYRWKILIVAYISFLTFAFALQSVPPVLGLIIEEFDLSHAQAGLIMSLFALPGIFLSIPAGLLADRYGPQRVGVVALLLVIGGSLLVALSPTYLLLLGGRALVGTGAITLLVIAPQFLSQWFLGKELGSALGIINSAMPLGTILSFVSMGRIGEALTWRGPIFIVAALGLVALAVLLFVYRPSPLGEGEAAAGGEKTAYSLRLGFPIWLVGAAWGFLNVATLSFMAFGPTYFQSLGYSIETAGLMASIIMWGTLALGPVVGYLLDKGAGKRALIALGGVGLAFTLALMPMAVAWVLPLMVFMTLVAAMGPVAILALPPDYLEARSLGLGYGILSTCLNAGAVLGPFLVGLARDVSGSYTVGFWVMASFAFLSALIVLPLGLARRAHQVPGYP